MHLNFSLSTSVIVSTSNLWYFKLFHSTEIILLQPKLKCFWFIIIYKTKPWWSPRFLLSISFFFFYLYWPFEHPTTTTTQPLLFPIFSKSDLRLGILWVIFQLWEKKLSWFSSLLKIKSFHPRPNFVVIITVENWWLWW